MTLVRRPSPFGELMTLRRAMDRLLDDDFFRPAAVDGQADERRLLPLDVTTTNDALVVEAALSGVQAGA